MRKSNLIACFLVNLYSILSSIHPIINQFILNASISKSKKIEEGSEELGEDEEGVNDTESLTLSCTTIVSI